MPPSQQTNRNPPNETPPKESPLNYKPNPFLSPFLVPAALPLLLSIHYFPFPEVSFRPLGLRVNLDKCAMPTALLGFIFSI